MIPYVAFLRGINVGGHAIIKMPILKAAFEKMGCEDVRTVLASGNVTFAAGQADEEALRAEIELGLKRALKMDVGVLLRKRDDLERLRSSEPFKGIDVTPDIRLYVTFLADEAKTPAITIPYAPPGKGMRILSVTATELFFVVDLGKGRGTPEAMAVLEKEFGSKLTTRNWNTIMKTLA